MGREVGGGIGMGKTCEPKAFSFQCMTKFTTKKKKRMFSVPEESFPRFRRLYGFSWRAISWPPRVGISSRSGRGWEGSFATSGSCIFLLVLWCLRQLLLQGSSLDD